MEDYDFSGWATRNNIKCSDGRTIMKDAFKDCDGMIVPLVWNHNHTDAINVLGHALLENRDEGVYTYGKFNDTEEGRRGKELVQHGDIKALSIYANQLKQNCGNVMHGAIREVSLVLAGANPGAFIDSVMQHGEESEEEAIIYTGEDIQLFHGDEINDYAVNKKEEKSMDKDEKKSGSDEETIADVYNTLTDKQKNVVNFIVGKALEEAGADDDYDFEEEDDVKHNVFDNDEDYYQGNVLTHSDQEAILDIAKKTGRFQDALEYYANENGLQHDAISSGFVQTSGNGNVSWLFPEYKDVRPGAPELITNDQGWISTVMNKVHKSPISRIRTSQVDIRNIDSLRAKGYTKGKQKKQTGNFNLVRRTTDPQTVYVKSALHRDDIIDITDFDYVEYLYNIDRMNLNEEIATAIMLGDGRDVSDEDKISPEHIRPIWTDDDLYTMHFDLNKAAVAKELQGADTQTYFGDNFITAEAMVNTCLYSREKFKGSGTPDMYITPHMLNIMLLARDRNGHRIYSSVSELATALNVGAIYTAEQFEGKTRTAGEGRTAKTKKLIALIVNLNDYALGATKGGEITHFTQFDIDFNQQKSLLEARCSGALTRVCSAIAIEEDVTPASGSTDSHTDAQG